METNWIPYSRRTRRGHESISLRKVGVAFSQAFTDRPEIKRATRVTVFIDTDLHRLGFRFHRNTDDVNSYVLTEQHSEKLIQTRSIYRKHEWLSRVVDMDKQHRRFTPAFDVEAGIWYIEVPNS